MDPQPLQVDRCGAQLRSRPPGTLCQRRPTRGHARCRLHGGADGSGRPPIHGRYSRLRHVFGEAWDATVSDPDLMQLNADVALFLVRESELLDRLGEGDTPEFRAVALSLFRDLSTAIRSGDEAAAAGGMNALRRHLERGANRDGAWAELRENTERRASIVDRASRAAVARGISAAGLVAVMGAILDIVRSELGDEPAHRVARRFEESVIGRVGTVDPLPALGAPVAREEA
jgi:hypothetical protein